MVYGRTHLTVMNRIKLKCLLFFFWFFVFQNLNILSLFLKNHKWKMLLERGKKKKIKIWTKLDGLSGGERKKKGEGKWTNDVKKGNTVAVGPAQGHYKLKKRYIYITISRHNIFIDVNVYTHTHTHPESKRKKFTPRTKRPNVDIFIRPWLFSYSLSFWKQKLFSINRCFLCLKGKEKKEGGGGFFDRTARLLHSSLLF